MEPKGTFGPRLRQERERRQISLSSIAANTKINQSLLEALERDDVRRWPSGIFRRAFLRSYATALGMNPDEIWKEFSERFPDPRPPVEAAADGPPPRVAAVVSERSANPRSGEAPHAKLERPEKVELVFRVTVPRSLVSWALWVKSLTSRGQAMPRSQNQNM